MRDPIDVKIERGITSKTFNPWFKITIVGDIEILEDGMARMSQVDHEKVVCDMIMEGIKEELRRMKESDKKVVEKLY